MKVLSYDPENDLFFVDVTWDEYRQLAVKHEIDANGMDAEEVIKLYKGVLTEEKEYAEESFYFEYIKNLYDVENMPNICLVVERDLSFLAVQQYDYPFGHMWNAYSPWKKIKVVAIKDLSDLPELECVEKGWNNV